MKKIWLVLPAFLLGASAELPQARLWSVFPAGGKIGSSFEVAITGADLDDATNLLFSAQGITAQPKVAAGSANIEPNKFVVTVGEGAKLGRTDVRVVGRFGASNPRAFYVSTLNEVNETEPNNSREEAMTLTLPVVLNASADAENYDVFKFSARKGERIILRCMARELDSRMEASLVIFDASGREVAHARQGAPLEFNPASDGEFVLQVNDLLYKGGLEYGYRLEAGVIPHVDFIEPPLGKAGGKSTHRLLGRNLPNGKPAGVKGLDGTELEEASAEIEFPQNSSLPQGLGPNSMVVKALSYVLKGTNGTSNPFLLGFATGEIVAQKSGTNAVTMTAPGTYWGRFRPVRENEWLEFKAEKGEVLWLEVFSERLGFHSDPYLLVQRITRNDKGEPRYADVKEMYDTDQNLGGREFNTTTRDPILRFEAPEHGEYRVQTRDLFNLTKGKSFYPYWLEIRKEQPGIALAIAPYAPPNPNKESKTLPVWHNFLRRGDKQPVKVLAWRKDGYAGEIGLIAEGLPKGVSLAPLMIPAGVSTATVLIQSTAEAEGFSGPLRIQGRVNAANKTEDVDALGLSQVWSVEDYTREEVISKITDSVLSVSAREVAPLSLDAEEKSWETSLGGKVTVPIKITRRGEFNNALKFRLLTDPPKEWDVDGKTNETDVEIDIKAAKLPVGRHNLFLLAQTSGKYRRVNLDEQKQIEEEIKQLQGQKDVEKRIKELNDKIATSDVNATFWCSPLIVNVVPSPVQFQLASSAMELKPGGKSELTVKISRLYDYKEPVEVAVNLPGDLKGVGAGKITIAGDQTEGKLVFESATEAPAGEKKITVTAIARQNGVEMKAEQPLTLVVSAVSTAKAQ